MTLQPTFIPIEYYCSGPDGDATRPVSKQRRVQQCSVRLQYFPSDENCHPHSYDNSSNSHSMTTPSPTSKNWTLRRRQLLLGVLGLAGLVGLGLQYARRQFRRTIAARLDALDSASRARSGQYQPSDVETLPAPVQRYFETVLDPDQSYATSVRLHQSGSFRLGGADSPWRAMDATQHYTTSPPGFVWDATIEVLPMVPARVIDYYIDGEGALEARILSAIQVANVGPNDEMNEGELLRYLAEAVWFPTALLPESGVEWEAIDEMAAQATLTHREQTVSAVFHFGDDDLVERVTAERYREASDDYAPWTGYFREYERRNGRLVPTDAEVEWTLPDGDLPYWRATIDRIDHGSETIER